MSDWSSDCREILKRVSGYLDRELTADEVEIVKGHLEKCGHCAEMFRWEESVVHLVKKCVCTAEVPSDLAARVKATLDSESD